MNLQREPRSKYLLVYDSLLRMIEQDGSGNEQYLPSERELSLRYRVDRLTVRKALNLLVEEGLVRKQPGKGTLTIPMVRDAPKNGEANSVAFVLPRGTHSVDRITEPFNSRLFYLIGKEISQRGYHLLYATVEQDGSIPESVRRSGGVAGFIFVSQVPEGLLREIRRTGLPAVLVNRISEEYPMVLEDRQMGVRLALEHLFGLGHRRILFINGVEGHFTTETCRESYLSFMHDHTREGAEARIMPSYWNFESGMAAMQEILTVPDGLPTAVCACNDMVALGAMQAAKQSGLNVPEEISFVGFDDTEQCIQSSPNLSTVSVNIPLIARMAVGTLFSVMDTGNPGPLRIVVPPDLVVRESTAPVR